MYGATNVADFKQYYSTETAFNLNAYNNLKD